MGDYYEFNNERTDRENR